MFVTEEGARREGKAEDTERSESLSGQGLSTEPREWNLASKRYICRGKKEKDRYAQVNIYKRINMRTRRRWGAQQSSFSWGSYLSLKSC